MPPPDTYLTIARPGRAELRIKASRFLGFAGWVGSESEAEEQRVALKKKYFDAAHQPFACRLKDGAERSSDDGEPKGTSGSAILTQIQSRELYGVQVVVVRYFGGTRLGKGGLSRAFSEVTQSTLDDAGTKKVRSVQYLSISLNPAEVNAAKSLASQYRAAVDSISYDQSAHLCFAVPVSRLDECKSAFIERFGTRVIEGKS